MGLVIASATIFRHNAVLYTVPLLIVLFFNIDKKLWLRIIAFTLAFFLIIKVPVYMLFDVEKRNTPVIEITGLPLTVIGAVAHNHPEDLDEELSDFVYSVASPEKWKNLYHLGDFNYLKFRGVDSSAVEDQGLFGMLRLMMKSISASPTSSIYGLISLTDLVYGFETAPKINYQHVPTSYLGKLLDQYLLFIDRSVFKYVRTYGIWLFALLTVALSKLKWRSWNSWKKILMIAPLFIHDFGTMLLLTGPEARFFFITFLVAPLLIVYLLTLKKEEELPCPKASSSSEPVQPV